MTSTLVLTTLAMLAFAGNSILARLALYGEGGGPAVDPAGFTGLRLTSGALLLALIVLRNSRKAKADGGPAGSKHETQLPGNWMSAAALLIYAGCFAFAYERIGAAVGALVLFTAVQATMIGTGLAKGERPRLMEIAGLVVAFGAFAWWIAPHVATPEITGASLMILSGIAWGIYSLRGRGASDPTAVTAGNFLRTLPVALPLIVVSLLLDGITVEGIAISLFSGMITSGLGYILWYSALPRLTATRAAIVQLSVPIIAAGGGVAFLSEDLTLRFVAAAILILGGIALAVCVKPKPAVATIALAWKADL